MSKRFITILETPDFPGAKITLKVPFFAVFSIVLKLYLAVFAVGLLSAAGVALLWFFLKILGIFATPVIM